MKSKSINILVLWLAFAAMACGCSGSGASSPAEGSDVYTPRYASGFRITCPDSGLTLITTYAPWQSADTSATAGESLMVVRGGEVPEGFTGQVLHGEARRIVAMSSTFVAMLDALGEGRRVVGVSGLPFIASKSVVSRRDSVGDVGYDGNIDYERLVSMSPDLVLLYGVDGASSMEPKLRELGIPFMYVGDYLEQSPLGKAEWMVALAEVCGMRGLGERTFAPIPERYESLRRTVADAAVDTVEVMLNAPYGDSWLLPPADSYVVRLLNDAGARPVHRPTSTRTPEPVSMEQAWLLADKADAWLNPGQAKSLAELAAMCPRMTDTRCFRSGRVFNNNARTTPGGGNEFFETATVHPDVVLADLIGIFHPELADTTASSIYYRQLR